MRTANTYRGARRNNWRALRGVVWTEHNWRIGGADYGIGTRPVVLAPPTRDRSRYMPHVGAKQRQRFA